MAPARRRVSYIIPPPSEPVPRLQLPPHGASKTGSPAPLLLPVRTESHAVALDVPPRWAHHTRHRLGVSCLALDTSTQLVGRASPEGILYSGGRDGLVISWDLGIATKRRERRYGLWEDTMRRPVGSWEIMTGWADEIGDEDTEDELRSDGDVLGDVQMSGGRRKRSRPKIEDGIPHEEQWETDIDAFQPGEISQFRQSVQAHTDWVNDILLCNYNQTLVSASSDGTVKAWSPHSPTSVEPSTIGTHADYVRCLAYCRDRQWLASGSFDRTIKLWDPTRTLQQPLTTLHAPEASGPKASVYALTTDPYGSMVAAGSPERVVRMWDPRSGKRIGKLVGHTDNIRAILISEDARYLLTGSADASIKLWSLATQRCLHTFTHHTDSVWSLHSQHPSLEIFYSGDRTGLVCKVDVEGCTDVSEGECVLITQDSERMPTSTEGINKIVAMDDNLLWTASGSSSIKRWRVPTRRAIRANTYGSTSDENVSPSESPRQSHRRSTSQSAIHRRFGQVNSQSPSPSPRPRTHRNSASISSPVSDPSNSSLTIQDTEKDREGDETWYGIPFESLVKLTSPNETFSALGTLSIMSRGRDPEIATLYSAASVMSVPRLVRSPLQSVFSSTNVNSIPPRSSSPLMAESIYTRAPPEETLHPRRTARADFEEREIASDAVPLHSMPDEVIHGDCGFVRCTLLNDRVHALTYDTSGGVAVWDIVRGSCLGRFSCEDIAEASFCGSSGSGSTSGGREYDRSPREAIEIVRERIEGEAVVSSWATIDTKSGLLGVHLTDKCFEAEIYADEAGFGPDRHFSDEIRINVGKWVLRNLFIHFIRDQQRAMSRRGKEAVNHDHHRLHRGAAPAHIDITRSPELRPRSSSDASRKSSPRVGHSRGSSVVVTAPNMLPAVPPTSAPLARSSPLITPMIPINNSLRDSTLSPIPQSPFSTDVTPVPRRPPTADHNSPAIREGDYFSLRTRRPSVSVATAAPTPAAEASSPDDFGSWGAPGVKPYDPSAPTPTTPGGLMGRLKAFGKGTKRSNTDAGIVTPSATAPTEVNTPADILQHETPKTPFQSLISGPLNPPSSTEAPSIPIPPNTSIIISEECASGWTTLYRGQVSTTGSDARTLEEVMPFWLLEYLLANKIPPVQAVKVPFVLLPYRSKDPNEEMLPELLNTAQSKLTASRFLRVRKLTQHVQDKLDRLAAATHSHVTTPRSSVDARSLHSVGRPSPRSEHDPHHAQHRPRAEDQFEILCNDAVLPLDMTLAAVRQYVWRQSGELVMHYRRKVHVQGNGNGVGHGHASERIVGEEGAEVGVQHERVDGVAQ